MRQVCASRITPTTSISAAPIGNANARHALLICKAGVTMAASPDA